MFKRISDSNELAKELKAHAIGDGGDWRNLSTVLVAVGVLINEYVHSETAKEQKEGRQACLDGIKCAYRTMRIL